MRSITRKTTVVVAHGIVALALLAGCDGDDRAAATRESTRESTHQPVQSEAHERSAHLAGQARTHGVAAPTVATPAPATVTSVEEFVPGSRHMPMR